MLRTYLSLYTQFCIQKNIHNDSIPDRLLRHLWLKLATIALAGTCGCQWREADCFRNTHGLTMLLDRKTARGRHWQTQVLFLIVGNNPYSVSAEPKPCIHTHFPGNSLNFCKLQKASSSLLHLDSVGRKTHIRLQISCHFSPTLTSASSFPKFPGIEEKLEKSQWNKRFGRTDVLSI